METKLLTISQFIKRYFDRGSRPSKTTVINWIDRGTIERNFLRAKRFDGEYFIAIGDAEAFMRASQVATDLDARRTPTYRRTYGKG